LSRKVTDVATTEKIHQYLFGLKDHSMDNISDFKGKTIGVPLKTIAEFYPAR